MSEMNVPITVRQASSMMNVPARYMSWLSNARKSRGPVVGRLRTTETMVAPETSEGSNQPAVLMRGLMATRTGYLNVSLRSSSPLALAVTT